MLRDYLDLRLSAEAAPSFDEASMTAARTEQVARLLHVSESWVREHSNGKEPRLPAMKLGQGKTALVRFHMNDIVDFIRGQRERARSRTLTEKRW